MALITTDYGRDIRIGKAVGTSSGLKNLAEALVRRLSTPTGNLFYDPRYGLDLRLFLNTEITTNTLDSISSQVKEQLELDERVQNASVKATYKPQQFRLLFDIQISPYIDKTFTLVVSVDKLSVQLLQDSLTQ